MKLYAVVYFPLYPLGRNGIIEIYAGRKQAVFRTSKFICSRSSARANQMVGPLSSRARAVQVTFVN